MAESALTLGTQLIVKAHTNKEVELLKRQMNLWNFRGLVFHTESIRGVLIAGTWFECILAKLLNKLC